MDGRRFDDMTRLIAMRTTRRGVIRGIAAGVSGVLLGRAATASAVGRTVGVLATFDQNGERFNVWAVDPRTIRQLRNLQRTQPTEDVPFPIGPIKRGSGLRRHNAPWGWHFDPVRVRLTEASIELCDATPSYVEDHIATFADLIGSYCPWDSHLVALRPFRL